MGERCRQTSWGSCFRLNRHFRFSPLTGTTDALLRNRSYNVRRAREITSTTSKNSTQNERLHQMARPASAGCLELYGTQQIRPYKSVLSFAKSLKLLLILPLQLKRYVLSIPGNMTSFADGRNQGPQEFVNSFHPSCL
jgi:hypothetical protein